MFCNAAFERGAGKTFFFKSCPRLLGVTFMQAFSSGNALILIVRRAVSAFCAHSFFFHHAFAFLFAPIFIIKLTLSCLAA